MYFCGIIWPLFWAYNKLWVEILTKSLCGWPRLIKYISTAHTKKKLRLSVGYFMDISDDGSLSHNQLSPQILGSAQDRPQRGLAAEFVRRRAEGDLPQYVRIWTPSPAQASTGQSVSSDHTLGRSQLSLPLFSWNTTFDLWRKFGDE